MPSQAFRDAAYPQQTDEVFAALLTIEHEALPTPILLTDAGEDIVYAADLLDANGNVAALAGTYLYTAIEIVPPGQSDEQMRGTIRVPNIDQAIGAALEEIDTPATITITVVLVGDPSAIVGGPHRLLELTDVSGDALVIEGSITRPQLTQEAWPKHWIRASVFRAAYRL